MELFFRICLFIVGLINFTPSLLVFFPHKIASSYGIDIPNSNHELLLRHRAVLFGIIGGIMLFSAITKKYYDLSFVIGLVSMLSFIILFLLVNNINPSLTKVMKIDIIGLVFLLIGYGLYKLI